MVVMRHPQSGAPWVVADRVDASIVNGGDGWHAHPTQALLDLFTMRERLGRVEGLKVTILGDVLHSRVARSDIWGLSLLGADVTVCGPPTSSRATGSSRRDAPLEAPRPGTDRAAHSKVPTW